MSHLVFVFIIWSYDFARPNFHESFSWFRSIWYCCLLVYCWYLIIISFINNEVGCITRGVHSLDLLVSKQYPYITNKIGLDFETVSNNRFQTHIYPWLSESLLVWLFFYMYWWQAGSESTNSDIANVQNIGLWDTIYTHTNNPKIRRIMYFITS